MMLVHHEERCPENAKLKAFIAWWKVSGPFPIVIIFGRRTDQEQRKLYAQGRTTPGKIVTHARTAAESAHGHDAAIDCVPVRETYSTGGVRTVYTGDEPDDPSKAEALRRLNQYADLGEQHDLESGRDFPGLHDLPHLQDRAWRTYPVVPEVNP